jgi:hypothetical protein
VDRGLPRRSDQPFDHETLRALFALHEVRAGAAEVKPAVIR